MITQTKRSMMKPICCILLGVTLLAGAANAITPQELEELIQTGEPPVLIDLRPRAAFEAGSLPNAMNMSLREALEKPLSGHVVFFDEGLGADRAGAAAEALAGKNNAIQADRLAGGYAGWLDIHGQTGERPGLKPVSVRYVSYQQLTGSMADNANDVVLIDLRPQPAMKSAAVGAPVRLTGPRPDISSDSTEIDLKNELPGYRVSRELPRRATRKTGIMTLQSQAVSDAENGSASGAPTPLYVLIDSGDGTAEKTAARLRADGYSRVVVLAGGETIIKRRGKEGLIRRGPGAGLSGKSLSHNPNTATLSAVEETR